MLCFVFAALIVILDQFFKRWIVITLELHEQMDILPGVLGLTHIQNKGAAFSILADQRWLLAGIAFIATIVLIFILLRYTEGFWGTLGLAAVLGGTVGNLIDRVFHGYVVDMFRTLFIDFAIFNIADIFITLGFITFCIHFIVSSIKSARRDDVLSEPPYYDDIEEEDQYSDYDSPDNNELADYNDVTFTDGIPAHEEQADSPERIDAVITALEIMTPERIIDSKFPEDIQSSQPTEYFVPAQEILASDSFIDAELPEDVSSALGALEALESELGTVGDYDMDELLREYGFEDESDK